MILMNRIKVACFMNNFDGTLNFLL